MKSIALTIEQWELIQSLVLERIELLCEEREGYETDETTQEDIDALNRMIRAFGGKGGMRLHTPEEDQREIERIHREIQECEEVIGLLRK